MKVAILILTLLNASLMFGRCDVIDTDKSMSSSESWCRAISVGHTVQVFERVSIDYDYRMVSDTKDGRTQVLVDLMRTNEECYQTCMDVNRKY